MFYRNKKIRIFLFIHLLATFIQGLLWTTFFVLYNLNLFLIQLQAEKGILLFLACFPSQKHLDQVFIMKIHLKKIKLSQNRNELCMQNIVWVPLNKLRPSTVTELYIKTDFCNFLSMRRSIFVEDKTAQNGRTLFPAWTCADGFCK